MRRTSKKTVKEDAVNKEDIAKVLGECHDGEDVKLLMKDGTVKTVPKSEIE